MRKTEAMRELDAAMVHLQNVADAEAGDREGLVEDTLSPAKSDRYVAAKAEEVAGLAGAISKMKFRPGGAANADSGVGA